MKTNKIFSVSLACLGAFVFLLGVNMVYAEEVVRDQSFSNRALGIRSLKVDGVYYDVEFLNISAFGLYGPTPGGYDFATETAATNASEEVNAALRRAGGILSVTSAGVSYYKIGYEFKAVGDVKFVIVRRNLSNEGDWDMFPASEENVYGDTTIFADFVVVSEPSTKDGTIFGPGVEGYLKTKSPDAAWYNTNMFGHDWVVFVGLDAKTQLQLTKCSQANIIVNDIKQIKQKGKISGTANTIIFGTPNSLNDMNFGGNAKAMIKLKGIRIGTVATASQKMVQCNDLFGGLIGSDTVKGVKIKAEGSVAGADAANVMYLGKLPMQPMTYVPATKIKGVSAKASIENVDAVNTIAAKPGKTKMKAKLPPTGKTRVIGGQYSPKSKNVDFEEI